MHSFLTHRKNKYSQNGEDGIIEAIFKTLDIKNGNFIEIGAWDGKYLSNCFKLFEEGWEGIYIEGDSGKFKDLTRNFEGHKKITCLNEFVGFSEKDSLDAIIDRSDHSNKSFDFVSIDVGGLDYFIFQKMQKHLPKVICIDVTSGHEPDFSNILPENIARNNVGQSIEVIAKKGFDKKYFPLCYSGNLFLIRNQYMFLFRDYLRTNEEIYTDFLQYVVGEDHDLMRYLYNLYCSNDKTQQKTIFGGHVFPENSYLKKFCESRL